MYVHFRVNFVNTILGMAMRKFSHAKTIVTFSVCVCAYNNYFQSWLLPHCIVGDRINFTSHTDHLIVCCYIIYLKGWQHNIIMQLPLIAWHTDMTTGMYTWVAGAVDFACIRYINRETFGIPLYSLRLACHFVHDVFLDRALYCRRTSGLE